MGCKNLLGYMFLSLFTQHSWNAPTPLIKGWGRTFQKLSHLGRVQNFCYNGGINLKSGCWCRNGGVGWGRDGCHFFTTLHFSSIIFTFSDLQFFELAMQDLHPRSHPSLVLKPGFICTFLIHSSSLQKCWLLF